MDSQPRRNPAVARDREHVVMEWIDVSVEKLVKERRQLRIAVVTETYPPEVNGVAMTTGRFVEGMLRLGHQIQLIRPRQSGERNPATRENMRETLARGVPIPRYESLKMGLPARSVLIRQWKQERPDIVQVVTEGPLGWSALSAAKRLRLPVVSEFHTQFDSYSTHYGLGWLRYPVSAYLRKFHNRSDLTLVPTQALRTSLIATGFRSVDVVARGVDTRLFSPAKRDVALRRTWGAGDDDLVVAYVGRLAPEKNLELLIQAFSAIREFRADARLVLVGDGPSRAQIASIRADGVVLAGMRTGEDLSRHYASADLFLFPSETETFGNVTAEALASGLPVVSYDYAAAAELVRHGQNGLLAPLSDSNAFMASAVTASEAATLARLKPQAAASVAHLEWDAIVARLVERFERVIHCQQGASRVDSRIVLAQD